MDNVVIGNLGNCIPHYHRRDPDICHCHHFEMKPVSNNTHLLFCPHCGFSVLVNPDGVKPAVLPGIGGPPK